MDASIGPIVLKCKADLSRDYRNSDGQNVLMAKDRELTEYERDFIARVRAARKQRFGSQDALCLVLKMEQDNYKWYETERLIPHELMERFSEACGISVNWLVTGRGAGPAVQPLPSRRKRQRKKVAA